MAYEHTAYNVRVMASGGENVVSATGTGKKGEWTPGFLPHIVRAAQVEIIGTGALAAGVVSLRLVDPAGSTSTTGDQFDTITLTTAGVQGNVYYVNGLDQEVKPGESIEANVTTGGGATATEVRLSLLVEPRWEIPGNNTDLIASA